MEARCDVVSGFMPAIDGNAQQAVTTTCVVREKAPCVKKQGLSTLDKNNYESMKIY